MNEYGDLADAGAVALTDDVMWVADSGLMRHAMECSLMLGLPVISHPEDASLSREGFMHEGSWSTRLGLRGLPAAAEVSAVARDIELARLTGASLHIAHVSCRASVQLIRAAREQGLTVTAETTPHHVFFTDADCKSYDTHFKMKPPLRSEDDRQALVDALDDGTISAISSDHAPHTVTAKERTFAHAPFGVIGLETAFAAAHDRLVVNGPLSLGRLIELMSAAPARILGKSPVTLSRGSSADLVILDPAASWVVEADRLQSRGRNCPWIGHSLTGRVVQTLFGGCETFSLPRIG
jgi:dihydroorotase